MKKIFLLSLVAFMFLLILFVFLRQDNWRHNGKEKALPKSTSKFLQPQDASWRKKVRYEVVAKLSKQERQFIYEQVIRELAISNLPDTAYHKVARKNGISTKDIKNIIGEAIASDWKIK